MKTAASGILLLLASCASFQSPQGGGGNPTVPYTETPPPASQPGNTASDVLQGLAVAQAKVQLALESLLDFQLQLHAETNAVAALRAELNDVRLNATAGRDSIQTNVDKTMIRYMGLTTLASVAAMPIVYLGTRWARLRIGRRNGCGAP